MENTEWALSVPDRKEEKTSFDNKNENNKSQLGNCCPLIAFIVLFKPSPFSFFYLINYIHDSPTREHIM